MNLATSQFDLYFPEEKRYIGETINNENIVENKVIPKEFSVWDKIDIKGPNKTIKNIVDYFKDNYNVDIDYINYKNYTLVSLLDDDKDLDKTIESLIEKYVILNRKTKYIKLEISGSLDDIEISTPTIRYIINND